MAATTPRLCALSPKVDPETVFLQLRLVTKKREQRFCHIPFKRQSDSVGPPERSQ